MAVWCIKPILSVGLQLHRNNVAVYGLRLRNNRAVAESYNFITRSSVFACLVAVHQTICAVALFFWKLLPRQKSAFLRVE